MSKLSFWFTFILALNAFAGSSQYLNFNSFIKANTELPEGQELDIGYHYVVPRYEENPDPKRQVTLEFYFGEYDGSEDSKRKVQWLKELLDEDKRTSKQFSLDALALGPEGHDLEESAKIEELVEQLDIKEVKYDNIHEGIEFSAESAKPKNRQPSSFLSNPRNYWTLIRGSTAAGGVFASLVIAEGLAPGVAATVGVVPGLVSGAITYHSGFYGNWLTNGRWSGWLMESESFFAKGLRKGLGLSPANLQKSLAKNKKVFQKKYPTLYAQMPEVFEKEASQAARTAVGASKLRLANIVSKLHLAEEYFKWWVTEVAFTAVAFKIPQAMAGISEITSIASATSDVLIGSTMGMAAQGPGDIAIQLRKFQKIKELKEEILAGKAANPASEIELNGKKVQKTLLEEIEMVLDKSGEHKSYTIGSQSHKALQRIENWARSRATMLSFFSVMGVGLEIAGVPLARPLLISVGIGGAAYYANVNGWINLKVPEKVKNYVEPFKKGAVSLSMRSLFSRYCQGKFQLPN